MRFKEARRAAEAAEAEAVEAEAVVVKLFQIFSKAFQKRDGRESGCTCVCV